MNINTSEGKQTHWAAYVLHSKKNKNIKPYLQSIQFISYLSKLVQYLRKEAFAKICLWIMNT